MGYVRKYFKKDEIGGGEPLTDHPHRSINLKRREDGKKKRGVNEKRD